MSWVQVLLLFLYMFCRGIMCQCIVILLLVTRLHNPEKSSCTSSWKIVRCIVSQPRFLVMHLSNDREFVRPNIIPSCPLTLFGFICSLGVLHDLYAMVCVCVRVCRCEFVSRRPYILLSMYIYIYMCVQDTL